MSDIARNLVHQEYTGIEDKIDFIDYTTIESSIYDDQFDIILSQASFEHYDSPEKVLERMVVINVKHFFGPH